MGRVLLSLVALAGFAAACGDDGLTSSAEWCDVARDVDAISNNLDTADDFRAFATAVDDGKDAAPSEIRDAIDTTAEFLDAMTAALEANNDNVILAIDAVEASGETGDVDAAEQEIADYNESECAADAGNTDDDDDDDEGILDGGIMEVLPTRLGLSEDDTRCVIETVDFSGGRTPTSTDVFDALEACGIDPLSLTDPE